MRRMLTPVLLSTSSLSTSTHRCQTNLAVQRRPSGQCSNNIIKIYFEQYDACVIDSIIGSIISRYDHTEESSGYRTNTALALPMYAMSSTRHGAGNPPLRPYIVSSMRTRHNVSLVSVLERSNPPVQHSLASKTSSFIDHDSMLILRLCTQCNRQRSRSLV